MNREAALAILRAHEPEIRQRGVRHAALFGSVARGEEGPDSDLDVMIDIDVPTVGGSMASWACAITSVTFPQSGSMCWIGGP